MPMMSEERRMERETKQCKITKDKKEALLECRNCLLTSIVQGMTHGMEKPLHLAWDLSYIWRITLVPDWAEDSLKEK